MNLKKLNECKVLVTPTSFSKYDDKFKKELDSRVGEAIYNTTGKPLKEKDLLPIIKDFDGYIAGLDEITAKVINNAKQLKVIARYGIGVNNVDLKAALINKIVVTNTPKANSVSVAELTIGLMIASARNIIDANNETKKGKWPRFKGISLYRKKVGIIGFGNIGKEVALRLIPFRADIYAYDVKFDQDFAEKHGIKYISIEELLKNSDFVLLHLPLLPDTNKIVDANFLSKIKPGSIIINTSRGELIDEDALLKGLHSGKVKFAAIDSFCSEPNYRESILSSSPKVIVTPHMGAATDDASNEMTRISIEECLAVLSGKDPQFAVVDPKSTID